ncbi:phage tail protein [Enterovibrio calviensis]|uniref:phage tail protein n=1 Tax=Enterovibrio calviensis TaxID=91359 RepID=UPI0037366BD9
MRINAFCRKSILVSTLTLAYFSTPSYACSIESGLGEVCYMASTYCPRGFYPLHGYLLSIGDNTALYSLFGNLYGGDGRQTYAVPNFRGRTTIHEGNGPGLTMRSQGEMGGIESGLLAVSFITEHKHYIDAVMSIASGTSSIPIYEQGQGSPRSGQNYLATTNAYNTVENGSANIPFTIKPIDGSAQITSITHFQNNNQEKLALSQPSIVLTACINTWGPYPMRP